MNGVARSRSSKRSQQLDLKRVFLIGRLHRASPGAAEFLQHLFGRRAAAVDDSLQRFEMAALVAAGMIEAAAPPQARMRQRQAFLGDFEQIAILDPRLEAEARTGGAAR